MRFIAVLVALLSTACFGGEKSGQEISKHAQNALDFNYKSVGIGATLDECRSKLGEPTEIDPFRNVVTYNIPSGEGRWTNITLDSGRVRSISALLTSEEVESIGGESVIQAKLVQKYGRPVEEESGVFSWRFDEVNRLIVYAAKESTVVINVQLLTGVLEEQHEQAEQDDPAEDDDSQR